MSDYPRRDKYFANRFCRLLTKSAVAQEIGPTACWLLTVVAHQEDSKRYIGPVTYYNEQLMPLVGAAGNDSFALARSKAVGSGWLHYEKGAKGVPGKYWVTIPPQYEILSDAPCDESDSLLNQERKRDSFPNQERKPGRNRKETRKENPSLPNLSLSLSLEESSPDGDGDSRNTKSKNTYSTEFEEFWTVYPIKPAKFEASKAYAKAVKLVGHDALMAAVRIFAPYGATLFDKAGRSTCPHAATWLNGRRWEESSTWNVQGTNGRNQPTPPKRKLERPKP